ncbi:hypothetical protein [Emticicia sp. W12TSBA100-4]|uniref:hypothetical protein n=1 Tax=Emticicia sp. W12TSBA100-4 TaxID=3160965 RepID=UPI00330652CE
MEKWGFEFRDEWTATEFVYDWVERTEKIIGSMLKKRGVQVSDASRENIRIKIFERSSGMIDLHFLYRDSLRFTDMGAGRGYHKGVRVTQADYRAKLAEKGRKRKRILMRPIFGRLAVLQEVLKTSIVQDILTDFNNFGNVINSN